MAKVNQCDRILFYLRHFGSITQLDALRDLGIMRLASRMSDLRKQGIDFKSETVAVKNRMGETCYIKRYFIEEEKAACRA